MLTSLPCLMWWASSWICPPAFAGVHWNSPSSDSTGSASGRWEAPTTTSTPNSRCPSGLEVKVSSGRIFFCILFLLKSFPVGGGESVLKQGLKHLWLNFNSKNLREIRFLYFHWNLYLICAKLGKCFWQWWSLRAQESLALSLTWLALSLVMKVEAKSDY